MSNQTCEGCWHWSRQPHMLDMEHGWCGLFERTMRAPQVCGMWETRMSLTTIEPAAGEMIKDADTS